MKQTLSNGATGFTAGLIGWIASIWTHATPVIQAIILLMTLIITGGTMLKMFRDWNIVAGKKND